MLRRFAESGISKLPVGPAAREVLKHLALAAALIALSGLASFFRVTQLRTTPWNPETGLAVAAGLAFGRPAILTVCVSMFISARLWGWTPPGFWEFASAALRALSFTGSAALFRHVLLDRSRPALHTILVFLAYAVTLTLAYAVVRLLLVWLSVGIAPTDLVTYTVALSVGNLIGIVTLVPIFAFADLMRGGEPFFVRWTAFHWLTLAALVATSFVVFGMKETDEFKFFYLVFIPVIAFSVRDGLPAAAFSVLLSDVLMLAILQWQKFESSTTAELQFLMLSLSATGLVLGAAVSDSRRSALALEESQSQLLQASRLSLASEMTAALAHELNQPLSSVRNSVRAIRRRLDGGGFDREAVAADIDLAVRQVDDAAALLKATREFLQRGGPDRTLHDPARIILHGIDLVRRELDRAGIVLSLRLGKDLPQVRCDEVQIQQVLFNVIRNAREAIAAADRTDRRIAVTVMDSTRPGFIEIAVEDSGPGVAPPLRSQLFRPLKSSKPEGLGLGLSLCSTIIRSHGGEFWLDESHSGGARFVFTLPAARVEGTA